MKYFHSHTVTEETLANIEELGKSVIFEIDLAYCHSKFSKTIPVNSAYIGHPQEFYTIPGKVFPTENVTTERIIKFMKKNSLVKLLIDIKDIAVENELIHIINEIGKERCLCHSFISNWTILPSTEYPVEPHWFREDIDLFKLNTILSKVNVRLIANCRGFSNENVEKYNLIEKMINDSRKCNSVISLGLYYPGTPLPKLDYIKQIQSAGYFPWINANIQQVDEILKGMEFYGMCDDLNECNP